MDTDPWPLEQPGQQRFHTALQRALTLLRADRYRPTRPQVVLSACLAGEPVRYNGEHKHLGQALDLLQTHLQLVRFCPEMAAGMGVPRAPIQWVQTATGERQLQRVDHPQQRAEGPLQQATSGFMKTRPEAVSAILKARSPSCGAGTAALVSEQGEVLEPIDGLFTAALRAANPQLAIVDENYFASDAAVYWFVLGHYLALGHAHSEWLHSWWPGSLSDFLQVDENTRRQRLLALNEC